MGPEENKYSGIERRRFVRIPFSFPVRITFCSGYSEDSLKQNGPPQLLQCNDIGIGGMQIKFTQKPKSGQYIKIRLTLPMHKDNQIINITGQILWSQYEEEEKVYKTGIFFVSIDEIEKIKLEAFIQESLSNT
jgi:c-di-GMP-binding flagellar brake protein YcgR